MKLYLTAKSVAATKAPSAGRVWVADTKLTGFVLLVTSDGKKVFGFRYGGRRGRRFMTIGLYRALTTDKARARAEILFGKVKDGEDPAAEREAARAIAAHWRSCAAGGRGTCHNPAW